MELQQQIRLEMFCKLSLLEGLVSVSSSHILIFFFFGGGGWSWGGGWGNTYRLLYTIKFCGPICPTVKPVHAFSSLTD